MKSKYTLGKILILVSSILWGTALVYTKIILDQGVESQDLVSMKMLIATLFLSIYIIFKDKNLFKTDGKGLVLFSISGLFCHALYNLFMFKAIENTSISVAVILLYTSPVYVVIMSKLIFREKITITKLISILICILGASLAVTGGKLIFSGIRLRGILFGLGSGFFYSLTTILNKFFGLKYKQMTSLFYTFLSAFIFSLSFSNPIKVIMGNYSFQVYIFIILLGFLSTTLAYTFYTKGLNLGVEPSSASIIATLEIPVSIIGSVILFNQKLSVYEILGIILVILSVYFYNKSKQSPI